MLFIGAAPQAQQVAAGYCNDEINGPSPAGGPLCCFSGLRGERPGGQRRATAGEPHHHAGKADPARVNLPDLRWRDYEPKQGGWGRTSPTAPPNPQPSLFLPALGCGKLRFPRDSLGATGGPRYHTHSICMFWPWTEAIWGMAIQVSRPAAGERSLSGVDTFRSPWRKLHNGARETGTPRRIRKPIFFLGELRCKRQSQQFWQ